MPRLPGKGWALDSLLIFALSAWLIWPLFTMDFMENWGSIESTFISDARMLRERGMRAQWQPDWYLGTRFDYVYPPALRYGTAALSKWLNVSTARAYHLYTAALYCLGIVGVYWLVRVGSGWRGWAWLAALAVSAQSPTFLFLEHFYKDYQGIRFMPVRLGVLIRYGEGPHMSALALLGFALAAAWWGVRRGQVTALVLAAIGSALVVSNNFYGATALAIFFPILVWAIGIAERDAWVLARAAAIAVLAYGLTAFWFTPSYLRVTLENMRLVSEPGHTWSIWLELAVMAVSAAVSWLVARGRPELAWRVFAAGAFVRIALYVLGHHYLDFRTIGEPGRLCPEFDQFFIIFAVTVFAWMWGRGWRARLAVIALIWLSVLPVKGWVRRSWSYFEPAKGYEHRVEYELTKWVHERLPGSRVFVGGSVRFWFNAWFDMAQVGGGSDQGTLNMMATWAYTQIVSSYSKESTLAWLQATGTEAVVVNYPESREYYHDFGTLAKKFDTYPLLYDNGRGDKIVRVPRKYPGLARIVRAEAHRSLSPPKADYDYDAMSKYVASIEAGSPRPAIWERLGPESMRVRATLEPGEALLVQETWDEGWQAQANGRAVPVSRDILHFMLLDPGPGAHDIRLTYSLPWENRAGRAFTAVTVGTMVFLLAWDRPAEAGGLMTGARKTALIAAGLFLANAAINAPLFLPGEHKYRDSIEGGYASMARFISEYPNPFGWNPLQYKGLPTHDWYLPVLPYTAALAIKLAPFLKPEHVYRLVVTALLCLGPVTMFLFVLEFTRSRKWSLIASLLYMFYSAGYALFPAIQADQGFTYVPWRVQVFVKYGEGPHNAGLVLIPLALIACWRAATGRRFSQLALAAAALAVVSLTNWIAGIALAWCCLMLLGAGPPSSAETGFLGRRILLASLLGYAFAAFWLTPEFIATTFLNWPADAFGYKIDPGKYQLSAALFAFPLALALVLRRWPRRYYLIYLLMCLSGFAWVVSLHYWYRIDVIPESRRYAVEVEFFLFAAVAEIFRTVLAGGHRALRDLAFAAAGLVLSFFFWQPWNYLARTWIMLRPAPRATTVEYQVAERLAALQPKGRVFVFGGTRFRLNSWFLLPQVGGTFESGLRNRGATHLAYHIQKGSERPPGERGRDALNMMRAAGVEYAAIHGAGSREHWRDIRDPGLAAADLEPVWREGGDAIYRVPFKSLANFLSPADLPSGLPVAKNADKIIPYIQAMDNVERPPVDVTWRSNQLIVLQAPRAPENLWITLRVSHHPGWRAWQDGRSIPVKSDAMGNLLLEPRPTGRPTEIELGFRPGWQQFAGTALSLAAGAACFRRIRRERTRLNGA